MQDSCNVVAHLWMLYTRPDFEFGDFTEVPLFCIMVVNVVADGLCWYTNLYMWCNDDTLSLLVYRCMSPCCIVVKSFCRIFEENVTTFFLACWSNIFHFSLHTNIMLHINKCFYQFYSGFVGCSWVLKFFA